eukprot:TRINITY_DN10092_c0_g2_i1.p1 TRINITY_DN10092_c0_g2~~TRINITY_DN10092_c0_g2_i1.p1  ORF type:complete len:394 (+),score=82.76 TRINITY_DN10092_c0_g2_i1:391-1572(+)
MDTQKTFTPLRTFSALEMSAHWSLLTQAKRDAVTTLADEPLVRRTFDFLGALDRSNDILSITSEVYDSAVVGASIGAGDEWNQSIIVYHFDASSFVPHFSKQFLRSFAVILKRADVNLKNRPTKGRVLTAGQRKDLEKLQATFIETDFLRRDCQVFLKVKRSALEDLTAVLTALVPGFADGPKTVLRERQLAPLFSITHHYLLRTGGDHSDSLSSVLVPLAIVFENRMLKSLCKLSKTRRTELTVAIEEKPNTKGKVHSPLKGKSSEGSLIVSFKSNVKAVERSFEDEEFLSCCSHIEELKFEEDRTEEEDHESVLLHQLKEESLQKFSHLTSRKSHGRSSHSNPSMGYFPADFRKGHPFLFGAQDDQMTTVSNSIGSSWNSNEMMVWKVYQH